MKHPADARPARFWIGSATRDHVLAGVEGGFCQLSHGRPQPLRRMHRGDWIAYYSARERFEESALCQRFTAIGRLTGDEVYRVDARPDFRPWRRDVAFCRAREADIRPLLPLFDFVGDEKHWGLPFRRGYFEVTESDFGRIAGAMLGRQFDAAALHQQMEEEPWLPSTSRTSTSRSSTSSRSLRNGARSSSRS